MDALNSKPAVAPVTRPKVGKGLPVYSCAPDLQTPLARRDPAEAALEWRGDYEPDHYEDDRRALRE